MKIDTWELRWKKSGDFPFSSGEYGQAQPYSYIKVWDDKGYKWNWGPWVVPCHPESGQLTLTYRNTNTWTHSEIRWAYATPWLIMHYVTLQVDVYVGA